jgi:hypothetical protein
MRSIEVCRFHKLGLALAVAIVCVLPASAQAGKGAFTTHRDVHWGSLLLPAGTYRFSVEHHASEVLLVQPKEGGTGYFILASAISQPNGPMSSELTIVQRGSGWYVTSMAVNDMAEVLLFQAPAEGVAVDTKSKVATIASK